ncbi:MAG TPA: hypothetical protein V6C85_10335 [Allocoleopsis sp.]
MKQFLSAISFAGALRAIAITSTLLLTQGCSVSPKAEEKPVAPTQQHESHSMGNEETHSSDQSNSHEGHSMDDMGHGEQSSLAQAKLTTPKDITPNKPVPLVINVQDSGGKAITKFDTFQEKLMHLIVVSDDLQFFSHIHPNYKENGRFEVEASFPASGSYTLFSDYKPARQNEQVSVLNTQVPGNSPSAPPIDLNTTKTFADTKANLTFSQPTLKAGQEVTLTFNLKQTSNNQPITDLQPYLGERGHLVILKQSSPLTKANYIHAHAMKDTPAAQVSFMTSFPTPGKYKLWGQFNRNGKIVVADFWVNVL